MLAGIVTCLPYWRSLSVRGALNPGPGKKRSSVDYKMSWTNHEGESAIREEGHSRYKGTSHREGAILFSGRVRTWYQIVTTRGRAKWSQTGRRKDKKPWKISRDNARDTTPSNSRNPIKDMLADCKPMKGIAHESGPSTLNTKALCQLSANNDSISLIFIVLLTLNILQSTSEYALKGHYINFQINTAL